ncbi:MAG: CinA family protein [Bdellovibrionales bacterium]|nr:CinA family protein [Bdellovibrionales bacterium]
MSLSNRVLVESIITNLEKVEQTFSIAESCTCGMLTSAFAYRSGVSKTFLGGVVSYANSVKQEVLGVSQTTLETRGAVSKETAMEMAKGAKQKLNSDWSVSVTGIAGPTGGSQEKPVGTVCFAVVGPNIEEVRRENFQGDRQAIQNITVDYALRFLLETTNKKFNH